MHKIQRLLSDDGVHLAAKGYAVWANVVDAYLAWQRLLQKYPDALIIAPQGRAC